jgi:hypothetical protein
MPLPPAGARGRAALVLGLMVGIQGALAGCVPDVTLPATCDLPTVAFTATLADGRLQPATFDVCRAQRVTLTVNVEQDGILHLHGYDDLLGAKEVRSGQPIDLVFEAAHVGQFPFALHTLNGQSEQTVGTLIVHDA